MVRRWSQWRALRNDGLHFCMSSGRNEVWEVYIVYCLTRWDVCYFVRAISKYLWIESKVIFATCEWEATNSNLLTEIWNVACMKLHCRWWAVCGSIFICKCSKGSPVQVVLLSQTGFALASNLHYAIVLHYSLECSEQFAIHPTPSLHEPFIFRSTSTRLIVFVFILLSRVEQFLLLKYTFSSSLHSHLLPGTFYETTSDMLMYPICTLVFGRSLSLSV